MVFFGIATTLVAVAGVILLVIAHFMSGVDATTLYTYGALVLATAAGLAVISLVTSVAGAIAAFITFLLVAFFLVGIDAFNFFGLRGLV
jgi:hypothetical protein